MDKIIITGIRAFGFHGVLAEERKKGQDFVVDIELKLNLNSAIKSDDLSKSVNYAEVAEIVKEKVEGAPLNLIEALAGKIGDEILKKFRRVQHVLVTVHKPEAPVPVEFLDVSVVVERKR
ncbi:MAG: dihydroneopterin aldolase [Actinobacteria bacterium]|uniref:7,8-dihydroneopterin aldolase n=1 Tax=Candidatus Fonsibacter lacus TaxID=2576439 RepID=A0A965GCE9_9PROT|nr:dihydroneopterin aldolase [Candidatus Fonsibacter lacus]